MSTSNSFWHWTLPPLPKHKRGRRPEPGFTDEELQYLENTLQIIESISIDTLGLNDKDEASALQPGENGARSRQMNSDVQAHSTPWNQRALCTLSDARLWAVTHPNTVAVFLVFVAASLLARTNVGSVQALVGLACLFTGLKIMAATEDGFELPPRRASRASSIPPSQLEKHQES
jgi:hypothetical protein